MECLLCSFFSNDILLLKDHYSDFHSIDTRDHYFQGLFRPDTLEDNKCYECMVVFPNSRKKNHMFLSHYNQRGDARNNWVSPLNFSKRGPITYYSINFGQHRAHYDFFSGDIAGVFLDAVHRTFTQLTNQTYKFQAYFELANQQRTPNNDAFLTENRCWLTNVFRFKYFNEFLRGELKNENAKRIINNGLTGSSWFFKRSERINVIVVPLTKATKIITS